jgi:hypothetical protein
MQVGGQSDRRMRRRARRAILRAFALAVLSLAAAYLVARSNYDEVREEG